MKQQYMGSSESVQWGIPHEKLPLGKASGGSVALECLFFWKCHPNSMMCCGFIICVWIYFLMDYYLHNL